MSKAFQGSVRHTVVQRWSGPDGLRHAALPGRHELPFGFPCAHGVPFVTIECALHHNEGERHGHRTDRQAAARSHVDRDRDRKSRRLNSSHVAISYAVFCLKIKKIQKRTMTHSEEVLM